MRRLRRVALALLGGTVITAALWTATGPGFRLPEALRSVFAWMLFPGWLVAPWDRYQLALLADVVLYSALFWLVLVLAGALFRRSPSARGRQSVT